MAGLKRSSRKLWSRLYRNDNVEEGLAQIVTMDENANTTFAISDFVQFEKGDVLSLKVSTAPNPVTVFFPVTGPGVMLTVQRVM